MNIYIYIYIYKKPGAPNYRGTWLKGEVISLNQWDVCMLSHFSCVWLFVTPWTVACQAPQSIGFSRQEYWSGLPCPSLGNFPKPGIKPTPPALQADFYTDWASREALIIETEVRIHCHLPLHASSSDLCDLSLDAILFSQFFIGLLTGRLGRRYSHLLITYSSFLLL